MIAAFLHHSIQLASLSFGSLKCCLSAKFLYDFVDEFIVDEVLINNFKNNFLGEIGFSLAKLKIFSDIFLCRDSISLEV